MDASGVKVSLNDCVMYAVGRALREVPELNAGWDEAAGGKRAYESVDVCVAVATDDGLITPIVTRADEKTLTEIGADVKGLAKKARGGRVEAARVYGRFLLRVESRHVRRRRVFGNLKSAAGCHLSRRCRERSRRPWSRANRQPCRR